ncbi:hypothetical protein ACFLSV_01560 [Bacteroidota bacterium]
MEFSDRLKAWEREIITVFNSSSFNSSFSYKEKEASLPAAGRGVEFNTNQNELVLVYQLLID